MTRALLAIICIILGGVLLLECAGKDDNGPSLPGCMKTCCDWNDRTNCVTFSCDAGLPPGSWGTICQPDPFTRCFYNCP